VDQAPVSRVEKTIPLEPPECAGYIF